MPSVFTRMPQINVNFTDSLRAFLEGSTVDLHFNPKPDNFVPCPGLLSLFDCF